MIAHHCISEKGGQDKVHLRQEILGMSTTGGKSAPQKTGLGCWNARTNGDKDASDYLQG